MLTEESAPFSQRAAGLSHKRRPSMLSDWLHGLLLSEQRVSEDSEQSRGDRHACVRSKCNERARCLSGRSQEDQATCLKEAGAARQERKEGKLQGTPSSPAVLERNAMQRCLNLSDKDRADCESRVKGQGIKEGSVRGGGTVTETVTTRVLPPGSQVPPDEKQIGTVPIVVPPPVFSSSPSR